MRKTIIAIVHGVIIILFTLCSPSTAAAARIAVVQSINIKPYNNALQGLKSACNCNVEKYVVSEMKGTDIAKEVYSSKPDVVVAIGMDALRRVGTIKKPIVYLMVVNPQSIFSSNNNITGVSMNISVDKQLNVMKQTLPGIKNIGLLHDPAKTDNFVKDANRAAGSAGVNIVSRRVRRPKDYPSQLTSLKGKIDAVWMIPDVTITTPETVEFLFLFSINNRIPVITFSDKYIDMGALMSINIDPFDIGKQAGEMVYDILSGKDVNVIPRTDARKLDITINQRTAKKLGISVNKEILNRAHVINRE